jgi:hypothetical protein
VGNLDVSAALATRSEHRSLEALHWPHVDTPRTPDFHLIVLEVPNHDRSKLMKPMPFAREERAIDH